MFAEAQSSDVTGSAQPPPAPAQMQTQPLLAEWSTGLFDCDAYIPSSLDAFLCPYCMSSAHFGVLYQGTSGLYAPICAGLVCADLCWLCAFKSICAVELHSILIRREIRRRYHIWEDVHRVPRWWCFKRHEETTRGVHDGEQGVNDGEGRSSVYPQQQQQQQPVVVVGGFRQLALDVAVSVCCMPCAVAQHHRELTAQGAWPGPIVFSREPPISSAVSIVVQAPTLSMMQ